jgi:hypothetical protein
VNKSLWRTVWLYLVKWYTGIHYEPAVLIAGLYSIEIIPLEHQEEKDKNFRGIAHNGKLLGLKCPHLLEWINCGKVIKMLFLI